MKIWKDRRKKVKMEEIRRKRERGKKERKTIRRAERNENGERKNRPILLREHNLKYDPEI
jgi:hypothetical protein